MDVRPIDANALKKEILNLLNRFDTSEYEFNNCYPYWIFSKALQDAPTLDYAPVRHGERVHEQHGFMYYLAECSSCGEILVSDNYNYCPYCGAKFGNIHDNPELLKYNK